MSKVVHKHSTVIDGVPYTTEDFPGGEAVDLGIEIMSLLPREELQLGISLFVAAMGDEESQAKAREVASESTEVFADALQAVAVAARQLPGGASAFLKRFLSYTTSAQCVILSPDCPAEGNVGENFDTHFRARLPHMRRVVRWVWVTLFLEPFLVELFNTVLRDRERADPTKA